MNAFTSKEELTLLPTSRISYPEHYADARRQSSKPGLVARFQGWLARQATLNELHHLTDRELSDIGLNRSELAHVFDPAFATRQR